MRSQTCWNAERVASSSSEELEERTCTLYRSANRRTWQNWSIILRFCKASGRTSKYIYITANAYVLVSSPRSIKLTFSPA
mmetsp:Transcript_23366/g.50838  ORF Transcript_23366/g.50838 Transcript_23366/m.50838 type:complete len:80 (-) Transcript_23366:72-311(-)